MSDADRLTPRQSRFVGALLEAPSIRDAAKAAHVAEATAWRYLSLPAVRATLAERQGALLSQAAAGLMADMAQARQVLVAIMTDRGASPSARVSAAGKVLDAGLRLFELVTLAERVTRLEETHHATENAHRTT